MQGFLKVKGKDGLVRDLSSGAIINTNASDYENYVKKRNANKHMKEELEEQAKQINNIKSDLDEIKQLLFKLINNS